MAERPKIQVRIFEERHWILLDDHKADVQRYKNAALEQDKKIAEHTTTIIKLQAQLLNKQVGGKDPIGDMMDSLFGTKKK